MFYCRPGGKNKGPHSEHSVCGFKQYTNTRLEVRGFVGRKVFKCLSLMEIDFPWLIKLKDTEWSSASSSETLDMYTGEKPTNLATNH